MDGKVVGVNGCHGKAEEGCAADVIDGMAAGYPDFAQHQPVHQLFQFSKLGVADSAPAYVLRVQPFRQTGEKQVAQHGEEQGGKQVEIKVVRRQQEEDLDEGSAHQHYGVDEADEVVALQRGGDGRFVAVQQIADGHLCQEQQVPDVQVHVAGDGAVFDQQGQRGHQGQPCQQDDAADDAVDFTVGAQVGADGSGVFFCDGAVKAVYDSCAEAQLRQVQYLEDGRKEAVHAQVCGPEPVDQHGADDERHQQRKEAVDEAKDDISAYVFAS